LNLAGISSEFAVAVDDVHIDEFVDGCGDRSPGVEPDVLERLLLSSLATEEADQR
jgi:hypothetical protein